MKTIKIIDLINDLFGYRELQPNKLPKKIRFNGNEFNYKDNSYYDKNDINIMSYIDHTLDLRVKVEIIEEEKEIKYIQKLKNKRFTRNQKQIAGKINELIEAVNELKGKSE